MSLTQTIFAEDLGLPPDAVAINRRAWFRDLDGNRAVFVDQTPFYCYPLDDPTLHRFCAAQLVEAGITKVHEVCSAFDINPRTFSRWRTRFQRQGIAGLIAQTVGRKSKKTPSLTAGIVQCYGQGKSTYEIATQLGVSPSTVQRVLREEGVQLRSPFDQHKSLSLTTDDDELSPVEPQTVEPQTEEPQIVEATSIPYASPLDQLATTMGWIEEAPVVYQSADGVPYAGALLGLALLEDTHLVQEARTVYGRLDNGWYGLRSLLWTLVVMALLRIKRPEQLKGHDPVALGCVLGMPRVAEVKTVRRKLYEISLIGKAAAWHRELARRRAEQEPAALATLYIDGHVRAYHGMYRLGKTRVSRLKRVMRAEEDYWVHQSQGQPLLVVHESVDSSFHEALCNSVLPEIREVIGDRRVRIVFDREGWSRELFHDLLRLNFDFVTYRKGAYEPLAESAFEELTFPVPGQPDVDYELAESTFEEKGWPKLRLVAVKKKDGGQTHVLATGQLTWESLNLEPGEPDQPAAEIAWQMFGRWSQENWFKYMRIEYALDVLVDYSVELDDEDHLVVNPKWRTLDRQVASVRSRLERAQAKYAKLVLKAKSQSSEESTSVDQLPLDETATENPVTPQTGNPLPKCKGAECSCLQCRIREQAQEVSQLSAETDRLREERKQTPKKIPLRDASDRDKVRLSYERKLFTDTIKLSAYEIETRLYAMLGTTFSNNAAEGRSVIRSLLNATGDIRVKLEVIEVHLDQLSAPRYTTAMQSLCQQLNARTPRLPETDYRFRFFVKPRPTGE
jgi:transposase-like protein